MVTIADQLGPFAKQPSVAAACDLSKRAWIRLNELRGGPVRTDECGPEHLLTRLLYAAESHSAAIRIDATWSLVLPAMSLLRDRYEQVVRFSWLARQTDSEQFAAFIDTYYAKAAKVFGNISPATWAEYEAMPAKPNVQAPLSKQDREHLSRWESLDLRSMAEKRDKLPPKTSSVVDTQPLADLYPSVYQQFSSVSHTDMFALNMLNFFKNSAGDRVLAADPQWPAVVCVLNAMMDIVQCHDAVSGFTDKAHEKAYDDLIIEWVALRDQAF